MEDEYEEPDDKEERVPNGDLPEGVIERLKKHAERTKQSYDEVKAEYIKYIADEYSCTDWAEEEEDLLVDWSEQMLVEQRSGAGAMAGTVSFVGGFVGVDPNRRDRRENLVKRAKRDFTVNPNEAIGSGSVGHYLKSGDNWSLVTKNGESSTDIPVSEIPEHTFMADGERITLLAKSGRSKAMTMMGRNYYFLGAAEDNFSKDGAIQLWRLDLQGEDADIEVKIGEPCRIPARPPNEDAKEAWKDVLNTSLGFKDKIEYSDDFVDDDMKSLLHPFKYWIDDELHSYYTPLEDLVEAFEAGSRTFTINGEQGRSGPLVFTKGTINSMSSEGRDNEYDESGKSYFISLSSTALQSSHGQQDKSEVMCWISSACHDLTAPFSATDNEGEAVPYAERSTVLVCGRVAVKRKDGKDIPNLKVMGVFADVRRIRRRQGGGDTSKEQFN